MAVLGRQKAVSDVRLLPFHELKILVRVAMGQRHKCRQKLGRELLITLDSPSGVLGCRVWGRSALEPEEKHGHHYIHLGISDSQMADDTGGICSLIEALYYQLFSTLAIRPDPDKLVPLSDAVHRLIVFVSEA